MRFVGSTRAIIFKWIARPSTILIAVGISIVAVILGFAAIAIRTAPMGFQSNIIVSTAVLVHVYFVTWVPVSLNGIGVQAVNLPGVVFLVTTPGLQPRRLKEH